MHAGSLKIRPEKNEWRTGKDYTVQVVNPKSKKVKELVAATPSHNNYKGILIALVVICFVCGLIFLSIQLLRPQDDGPRVKGRKITLADIASKQFHPQPFNGSWISDSEILFRDVLGGVSIFDANTFTSKTFVTNTTFRQLNAHKFSVSADRKYLMLVHDESRVWDHSFLAKYTIYDIKHQFLEPLIPFKDGTGNRISGHKEPVELQFAEWGPTGNAIVMVYDNDIYYKKSASSPPDRITKSGELGVIFNGIPDWLYEVEIFGNNKALWMSPDGACLLYASFNDSLVGEVSYPWYADNSPYSQLKKWRYPKTGTTNPEVKLWEVRLYGNSSDKFHPIPVRIPDGIDSRDHYISSVEWIGSDEVSVIWMNRVQSDAQYFLCAGEKLDCKAIYRVSASGQSGLHWLDFPQPPLYSLNRSSCLLRIPWRDGEAGYFHHVIWLDIESGKEIPITRGPFEITQISAWDQLNHFIYFIGVPQGKPGERHLYRASETTSNSSLVVLPDCITCSTEVDAEADEHIYKSSPCLFNQVTFSHSNHLFINDCAGPGFPKVTLNRAADGEEIYVLDNNTETVHEISKLGLPQVRNIFVEVADGYKAPVRLFLPGGLLESEEYRFPTLLRISGAPGTQLISEKWRLSWASYLTSQKNWIVVEVDARGSGYQGELSRQAVYKNLGSHEVEDHLAVMKYLKANYPYIDENNMAVWGWGFGGSLSLLALAEDNTKLFKCGIAVSPITKWEFYDTVYTERYLGLPNLTDNFRGYEAGDVVNIVRDLKDRKFLIVHGTADEKVHYQHTLYLSKVLIREGIPFTEMVYPDEGHEYSGVTEHVYNAIEDFLELEFDKPEWDEWEKASFLGVRN